MTPRSLNAQLLFAVISVPDKQKPAPKDRFLPNVETSVRLCLFGLRLRAALQFGAV